MLATTKLSLLPQMADHPRYLETIVGRLLELVVYSIEGLRSRIHRPTVH